MTRKINKLNGEQADSTALPTAHGNQQTPENQNEGVDKDNGEELPTADGNQQTPENKNEEVETGTMAKNFPQMTRVR